MTLKPLTQTSGKVQRLLITSKRCASRFSFVPTPELTHRSVEEIENSVPDMSDVSKGPRLYTEMVRPGDVCDVLLRPNFNDVVVTALADGAPFSGDVNYKLTSKSSISSSRFLFANIAARWIDDFNRLFIELGEIPENKLPVSFLSDQKIEVIKTKFDPKSITTSSDIKDLIESLQAEVSAEAVVEFLLTDQAFAADIAKYNLVLDYLEENIGSMSRQQLPDFLERIARDAEQSGVYEKTARVNALVNNAILSLYPEVLAELNPETLDRLAAFATQAGNIEASTRAFTLLVQTHKLAPHRATFRNFVAVYSKAARQNSLTKQQILKDLTCIKPVFFYYGLDADSFELLLSRVIDNSYDLAQFVRLASNENSAELLSEYAEQIFLRLHHIHKQSTQPKIYKAVETTQFARLLIHDCGVKLSERLRALLQTISAEYGITFEDLHLADRS